MGKDFGVGKRPWPALGLGEQQLLLACLRSGAGLPAFSTPIDWALFARRAVLDGLGPLLYRRLQGEAVPAPALERLKRDFYRNVSANHLRLQELRRLGQRLQAEGIPLLVLKGAALALTVYADSSLRYLGDLDVAVPPADARRALACLQAEGYRLQDPQPEEGGLALLQDRGWHVRLARQVDWQQVDLELHWPLRHQVLVSQVATLDLNRLWATAVPLEEESNLWQPAAPAMLLHLCLHTGLQHRFTELGLRHYVDLDLLLRQAGGGPEFWPAFLAQAQDSGAAHASYFSLLWAARLLASPVPAAALEALRPPAWKCRLGDRLLTQADILNRRRALHDGRLLAWRILTTDHLSALWRGPWRTLFPGRAFLGHFYHVQDPVRLVGFAIWHPFRAVAHAGKRRLQGLLSLGRQRLPGRKNS